MDSDWGLIFIIIQLCGALALIIQNYSNFLPCGKQIMKMQIVSSLLWAFHYGMRGLENVMVMCCAGALLNAISSRASQSFLIKYNVFHFACLVIFLSLTLQGNTDLLPIIAVTFGFVRMISRDNLVKFHSCGLVCAIIWTVYHALCSSWFGVMNDGIVTVTTALALMKALQTRKSIPVTAAA